MASVLPLLFLLLCAAAAAASAGRLPAITSEAEGEAVSTIPLLGDAVHDMLPKYGLPRGLLPASVTNYYMTDNDHFVVELAAPCYVKFTDLAYYDRVIKGKVSYGSITEISGVQVKKLFAWLPITAMVVDADGKSIDFEVGFLSEKLPVSMFAEIPSCRKGSVGCHGEHAAAAALVAE